MLNQFAKNLRLGGCLRSTHSLCRPRVQCNSNLNRAAYINASLRAQFPRMQSSKSSSEGMPAAIVSDTTLPSQIPESDVTAANAPTKNLFSLNKRTVVVTGGGRGLGITLATAVLEAGGDVVCLDVLPEPSTEEWTAIQKLTKGSGLHASYKNCNVTDEAMVESVLAEAAKEAEARGSPIRGLINSAGIQQMKEAIDYPIDGLRRILDVNVTGSFVMAKHVARIIHQANNTGSIVLVASMSGQIANRGLHCSAYNTSKGAVQQMGRSFAAEFGAFGIRVNTLSPGYIRTNMTDELLAERPDLEKMWLAGAMLGRLGAPEDFKAPTVFLLADGSSWMTGADLRVDGGHCASA